MDNWVDVASDVLLEEMLGEQPREDERVLILVARVGAGLTSDEVVDYIETISNSFDVLVVTGTNRGVRKDSYTRRGL